jgi:hypothetical protein
VTELLDQPTEVRLRPGGEIEAVLLPEGWRLVARTTNRWLVETDWWRQPVRREYHRCLTRRSGDWIELYRDLETGTWHLARRYG